MRAANTKHKPLSSSNPIEDCVNDLLKSQIIQKEDTILFSEGYSIPYANVVFNHSRQNALNTIKDYLNKNDVVLAGRYGLWDYLWSDQSIQSGINAADNILSRLSLNRESV